MQLQRNDEGMGLLVQSLYDLAVLSASLFMHSFLALPSLHPLTVLVNAFCTLSYIAVKEDVVSFTFWQINQ